MFLGLIHPLFLQDLIRFLKADNNRPKEPNKVNIIDYKVFLSSNMPQQQPSRNICALFTLYGCYIVLSGVDVSIVYTWGMEEHGKMSLVCNCIQYHDDGKVVKVWWVLPYLDPGVGWISKFEISISCKACLFATLYTKYRFQNFALPLVETFFFVGSIFEVLKIICMYCMVSKVFI